MTIRRYDAAYIFVDVDTQVMEFLTCSEDNISLKAALSVKK